MEIPKEDFNKHLVDDVVAKIETNSIYDFIFEYYFYSKNELMKLSV